MVPFPFWIMGVEMAVYGCWGSFALTGISGVDLPFVGYGSLSPARLLKIDMVLTKLGWSDWLSNPGPFSLTGILGVSGHGSPSRTFFFFFKYDFLDCVLSCWEIFGVQLGLFLLLKF